jgi:hypothetical protein
LAKNLIAAVKAVDCIHSFMAMMAASNEYALCHGWCMIYMTMKNTSAHIIIWKYSYNNARLSGKENLRYNVKLIIILLFNHKNPLLEN